MSERISIQKIAKLVACAPSTVSRVLSGNYGRVHVSPAKRQKILEACAASGYEPNIHASRFFSRRSGTIALITPEGETGLEDENLSRFANSVYYELNRKGYRLLLLFSDERFLKKQEYLQLYRRKEVDAVIVWGVHGDTGWLDELQQQERLFLLASNQVRGLPAVICDDETGMSTLVQRCRDKGARKLIYIGGTRADAGLRREKGFLAAAKGCEYRLLPGDFTVTAGYQAVPVIKEYRPDAVICVNDRTAIGVIMGLRKEGVHVPEDLLVTGADNIPVAEFIYPALTTYDQRPALCGQKCVEILLAALQEKKPVKSFVIPPEFHFRDSA